jgi:3',5'-cyclic AMP phosphodiesterase CpdA
MTKMLLLHISDLHFTASPPPPRGQSPARLLDLAADALRHDYPSEQFVLALSGDITTKGRSTGFDDALRSIALLRSRINVTATIVCPGNHDITRPHTKEFTFFNRFAFSLTEDAEQLWQPSKPVCVVSIKEYSFILVNSAHEGDHTFGSAPIDALKEALHSTEGTSRIVMMHHSPISSAYAGGGMADAYDLLALVSQHKVTALLHGHVHSDQALQFGPHHTLLYGAGSLGFLPDPSMNNQFAIHEFTDGSASDLRLYRYYQNHDRFIKETV